MAADGLDASVRLAHGIVVFPGGATIEFVAPGQASHTLAVISDLAVTAGSPPLGTSGLPYRAQAQASGGAPPYSFAAAGLPPGLSIDGGTGAISGTPTTAGIYPGTVTVTDSRGIVASAPLSIAIFRRGISCLCRPPLRPRITAAHQSAKRWREGKRLARVSRKVPVGTTFSFVLNEKAKVSFRFTQSARGRRVGHRCVAQTKGNRHRRSCTRTLTAGLLAFAGHVGTNRVAFQGRVSRTKKLRTGRYTLIITATDTAGRRSAPVSLSFTIVR